MAALVALLLTLSVGLRTTASSAGTTTPEPEQKNVLVILTDDQPYRSSLARMEGVNALDAVRFEEYFTNNPLCCPSRATMLTGLYDHHTGVTTNDTGHRLDDSSTIATWFDDAGYRTGLFGKYLNHYPFGRGAEFVPPGWDEWQVFTDDGYYDYELSENGEAVPYGSNEADYSTDVLADKAEQFVASSEEPFFAILSPNAPHLPATAAPRHEGMFATEEVKLPLNFNRIGDRPVRWIERLGPKDPELVKGMIRLQWEVLEAVDEAVASLVDRLDTMGELDETVIVYTSDNGLALGSHRWIRKTCGYEECGHVPLLVAAPGIAGRTEDALVSNVDLAPTLADLAGVPTPEVDGESLAPIISGFSTSLRRPILMHNVDTAEHVSAPSYRGIRTHGWKLIAYADGERELYDLRSDPHELRNLAGKPRNLPRIHRLQERIRELRRG